MKRACRLFTMLLGAWVGCSAAATLDEIAQRLPEGQRWLNHASEDLLPYWTDSGALGEPYGQFPSFRCMDGSAYDSATPCPEFKQAPDWIRSELGRNYVRMQARQTFAYVVGFHLTGKPELLAHAAAGVNDIRKRALDRATGSAATYYENGKTYPKVGERTAQDLAYAGVALAAYYYVTRDAATLADLDRLHTHLMSYYDAQQGQMRWTLSGPEAGRHELVAQLDPLNAYMILTTPLLHGEQQKRWQADMRRLVGAIRTQYCTLADSRCHGTLDAEANKPGGRHNDFGHSAKAYWMSLLAARQLGDTATETWAHQRGEQIIHQAYLANTGSWASRWRENGLDEGKEWWIYAELDQLSTSFAMEDASYAQYLPQTWDFWLAHFPDPKSHEVYGWVSADGTQNSGPLKQHQWKNGYHSLEHALVGYLGAQALHGKPAVLYYALPKDSLERLQPYYFPGKELSRETEMRDGSTILKLAFSLLRPKPDAVTSFTLPTP